jgi:hypothetical protein
MSNVFTVTANTGARWVSTAGMLVGVGLSSCVGGNAPTDPFDAGGAGRAVAGATGGAGAGAAGGGSSSLVAGSKQSHYPLVVGATWSYHHTNPTKQPWDEVDTIEAATYMGKQAFALTDEEDGQGQKTRSLLAVEGTGVYRVYKEVAVSGQVAVKVAYDPGFLRYDEAWTAGASMTLDDVWTQTCVFSSTAAKCAPGAVQPGTTTHSFKVINVSTQVTVPAGSFDAVEIERVNPGNSETKRFWFAAGVGKVREFDTTSGAIEELTQYVCPEGETGPSPC